MVIKYIHVFTLSVQKTLQDGCLYIKSPPNLNYLGAQKDIFEKNNCENVFSLVSLYSGKL